MRKIVLFACLSLIWACKSPKTVTKQAPKSRIPSQAVLKEIAPNASVLAVRSRYLLKDSATVKIYLELEVKNLPKGILHEKFRENFRINWLIVPDFGIKERLASGRVDISQENCMMMNNKVLLTFDVPRVKNRQSGLLLTEISEEETNKKATNDLSIDFSGSKLNERFGIFQKNDNIPSFQNYISKNDTFELRSLNKIPQNFFLVHYNNEFDAAAAPMSTSNRPQGPRILQIDTVLKVSANMPLMIKQEGLYYVTDDTASTKKGFGILIVDDRYPKFMQPKSLSQPLLYMSTNQEIQALKANKDIKQAIDLYFLTLTSGNQSLARRIIKTYYNRVEEANRLFTTYKEGWKTDKGMIYIILGSPNRVQKGKDREIWVYSQNQNFSEIIFTFYRKQNQFTENHYELLRYPEYQAYWYPFVEAWRTGNVSE